MATPHIAGLAAILMEAKPGATADEVEQAIFGSCALSAGMSPDRAGRGIPSGLNALQRLTGGVVPAPRRIVSPRPPKRRSRPSRQRPAARRGAGVRRSSTARRSSPKRRSARKKR
jgi:subtilisin family serine protease